MPFSVSLVSPFKLASLTEILPDIIFPSAGISSPADSFIISPTTTSSMVISFNSWLRRTLVLIFEASAWSCSKAFSLPYSDRVEINEARNMAITMPIVSYQSKFWNRNKVLMARAIKSILIIGSPKVAINLRIKLSFLAILIVLSPYFWRLFWTSSSVYPVFIMTSLYRKLLGEGFF